MSDHDARIIAKGLAGPQRKWMLAAKSIEPFSDLYTYPPPNTHRVLMRLGLVMDNGCLLPLGMRVRAALDDSRRKT